MAVQHGRLWSIGADHDEERPRRSGQPIAGGGGVMLDPDIDRAVFPNLEALCPVAHQIATERIGI